MIAPNKKTGTVVIAAGGNKTFASLIRDSKTGYQGWQFVDDADDGISGTITINLEISYDGANWATMTDANGEDVTGDLTASGSLSLSISDLPFGASVRPKFVTNATGSVVVTTWS